MSSSNIVTESGSNKILPGDKTGLPWEIWQMILSWLSATDLCHVSCVCKAWAELVISVDPTRWKELYYSCSEWHHPFWPLNIHEEPPSWRLVYQEQYISTKFWCQRQKRETKNVNCTVIFKKNILQKTIHVGPGLEHESLRTALAVANDYDRIVMHPGIYDEQFEISAKVPFELIGYGELGSVILNVGIKQLSESTRLSSLVLRAPWFTTFIVNVSSGYLQIDNCIVEDGMICCKNPSTVHIRFCTFRHASVILQHMNVSIIENCEFSQSGGANIVIEGHPKEERNWAYSCLKNRIDSVYHQRQSPPRKKQGINATDSFTSTTHSTCTRKSERTANSSHSGNINSYGPGLILYDPELSSYKSCSFTAFHHLVSGNYDLIDGKHISALSPRTKASATVLAATVPEAILLPETSVTVSTAEEPVLSATIPQATVLPASALAGTVQPATIATETVVLTPIITVMQNNTSNNDNQKLSNSTLFSDDKEMLSKINTSQNLQTTREPFENCLSYNFESQNSKNFNRKIENKQSFTSSTLSHVFETISLKSGNGDGKDISKSCLHLFNDLPNLKCAKHVVFKNNDCGKSSDSQVVFQPIDNIPVSQPVSENLQKFHDKQTVGTSQSGNIVQLLETETDSSKISLVSRSTQQKISNNEKQSVEDFETENLELNHKHSISSDNIKDIDIYDNTGHKTVSLSKNEPVANILDNNVNLKGHNLQDNIDLQETEEFLETESKRNNTFLQKSENYSRLYKLNLSQNSSSPNQSLKSISDCSNEVTSNSKKSDNKAGLIESVFLSTLIHTKPGPDGQEVELPALDNQDGNNQDAGASDHGLSSQQGNDCLPIDAVPCHPIRRSQSDEVAIESDDDLSILDEIEDSADSSEIEGDDHEASSQTTGSSDTESMHFTDTDEEFSSSEESVIMLPHLNEFCMNKSTSARGVNSDTVSINSDITNPIPVDILKDTFIRSYVGQVHGCLINQCRMNHSKGGLMVSLQAHAVISECDISNVGYGLRCIQNSRVVILKNKIHHCQTSGIFMRLAASGLIAGNDIHSNNEAGIDIRKSADPLVQFNQIHHGKRSGVVVLGSGRGHIKENDIYNNAEAGVYVLYGGNPIISENYIFDGRAAGVAVNAGGKGCIVGNVIRGNYWSGIDIRNRSSSLVSGNNVINGASDGIVVGVDAKGSIENNVISGNGGCGIWIMAAKNLSIHGNQICNNGHSGILMLDKTGCMTSSMENHLDQFLTNINHRAFSQCSDGWSLVEPSSDFALLQYNNIYSNKGEGIFLEMNKEVRMLYNSIHLNQRDGIYMAQNAPAVVEGNSVSNNGGSGIVTSTHNKVTITGNGIYENTQHGVVCRSSCVITENDIMGQQMHSVLVQGRDLIQMTGNRLCSSSKAAVQGEELCDITAANNRIFDRGGGDFSCQGHLVVSDNVLVKSNFVTIKTGKSDFSKTDFLTDPPPRPHIPPPPAFTKVPVHHTAVITQVTTPSSGSCKQESRLCVIL